MLKTNIELNSNKVFDGRVDHVVRNVKEFLLAVQDAKQGETIVWVDNQFSLTNRVLNHYDWWGGMRSEVHKILAQTRIKDLSIFVSAPSMINKPLQQNKTEVGPE